MVVNQILNGDTETELKKLPDNLVDTIVTSPPYWGLRDYGVKGQIGLEPTLNKYIYRLLTITQELKRVLKPTGVMFWNHGDCYQSTAPGTWNVEPTNTGNKAAKGNFRAKTHLPAKCMVLQNYRLILQMIDEQGWILRNTIIWNKPNHMPSSVRDRFANSYEPVFMLVKQQRYWFDLDAVRKPHAQTSIDRLFRGSSEDNKYSGESYGGKQPSHTMSKPRKRIPKEIRPAIKEELYHRQSIHPSGGSHKKISNMLTNLQKSILTSGGKNPGDLWTIPTQPFPQAHFATFPEKLIEPMIKAGCPEHICKKCGKARVRICKLEKFEQNAPILNRKELHGPTYSRHKIKVQGGQSLVSGKTQTLGWTKCKCNAGFRPGIALDPFMGAGTVGVVAKSLGRQYLGIELSPDYIKIAEKRLLNTMGRLF